MERDEMLKLWNDMAAEGNWIPSWTDSLSGLTAEEAAWCPDSNCHSVWQEVRHVIYWRKSNLNRIAGGEGPTSEEAEREQFALPEKLDQASWEVTVEELQQTHAAFAAAIQDPAVDVSWVPYHLIHDAYHLGRITQVRAMRGVAPKF